MMPEKQQDESIKRIAQGREAKQLLQNPLIEGFFESQYKLYFKAFCELPMGSSIENYQTIQHDYLALKRLRVSLEEYVQRAKMDVIETKRQEGLPEDIEV